jgi:uncharacterized protein YegP (UPF0339 family)
MGITCKGMNHRTPGFIPTSTRKGIILMAKFDLYRDKKRQYRWKLRADNNQVIADSAEGYVKKSDCEHGVELVQKLAPKAKVEDQTKA